jgi:hypothetical protein
LEPISATVTVLLFPGIVADSVWMMVWLLPATAMAPVPLAMALLLVAVKSPVEVLESVSPRVTVSLFPEIVADWVWILVWSLPAIAVESPPLAVALLLLTVTLLADKLRVASSMRERVSPLPVTVWDWNWSLSWPPPLIHKFWAPSELKLIPEHAIAPLVDAVSTPSPNNPVVANNPVPAKATAWWVRPEPFPGR